MISVSDFHTGIDAAVHATLDIKQHISHTRTTLVDTIAYFLDSEEGVIPVQEELRLLRFVIFWSAFCLNRLAIQLIF